MDSQTFSPVDDSVKAGLQEIFPLSYYDPADYTGLFVALASRHNSATTTGGVINAADGLGIRGHMAITGVRARSWAKEHVDLGRAGVAHARRLAMPSR